MPAALGQLNPITLWRNPVMFVGEVGAVLTNVLALGPTVFAWLITGWLWLTVVFANLAEAVAEGRGKPRPTACAGNGSAFAGVSGNTKFSNTTTSIAMLLGRYLPMLLILVLAGHLVTHSAGATTIGTLRAHGTGFVVLTTATAVILALLNFLPAATLGPLA